MEKAISGFLKVCWETPRLKDTDWGSSGEDGGEEEGREKANTQQRSTPDFEAIISLVGLTAVACLVRSKQR